MGGERFAYRNREEAGAALAEALASRVGGGAVVLAIPNGGVPVALAVRRRLGSTFGILVVRKLHIPWNREAGFGAVAPDGSVVFNESVRLALRLSAKEEEAVIEEERAAIARRIEAYGALRPPDVAGRTVILVDDGLASGYSMWAAVRYVRRRGPEELIVAVPTASASAVERVARDVDSLVCPNVRAGPVFAVADAYEHWYDVPDEEVLALLQREGVGGGQTQPAPKGT